MRTIKKAQNGATTPRQRQDSIIAAKRAQAAERKAKSYAFWNKKKEEFNQRAKDQGMTPEQYSRKLEKDKKKPDAFQGDGGFKEKRYNPVCGKGGCKKNGGSIKKAKSGATISKAKDGKWMQKAAASIKRRGTAGKCTPITKPGCTGKAKALAKTFKKIAAKRKSK